MKIFIHSKFQKKVCNGSVLNRIQFATELVNGDIIKEDSSVFGMLVKSVFASPVTLPKHGDWHMASIGWDLQQLACNYDNEHLQLFLRFLAAKGPLIDVSLWLTQNTEFDYKVSYC